MKIGFFTNTYLPICYGSVISIESFRKNLEKLGHQVYVFAPHYPDYEDKNKRVFRYPSFLFKYKIDYPISIPIDFFIKDKIEKLGLDIIHVHQPFSLGQEGLKYAKKKKISLVFTHHAKYEDYVHYVPLLPENFLAEIVKKESVKFANNCDLTIAPSQGIRKILEKRGARKNLLKVLPTGINVELFRKGNRKKIRDKYKIKNDEILCLNIGRINKEKNLNMMFSSIFKIIEENEKIKMMFIGEGALRKKFLAKVKEKNLGQNIIFTGFIKHQEIKNYLKAADIYLQTSTSETQGLTILEAMASGLPVVAVKATGTEDFIVDKKNGFLTKNSQKDFSEKLKKMIKNKKAREDMISQAQKDAKNFDELNQTKKLVKIYESLIKK